jgi:hypothetical protein
MRLFSRIYKNKLSTFNFSAEKQQGSGIFKTLIFIQALIKTLDQTHNNTQPTYNRLHSKPTLVETAY